MDEAEDGAEEDVEDTEDEPTSLIALFLKKTKIKVFFMEKKGQQWPLLLLLDSIRTQSFTYFLNGKYLSTCTLSCQIFLPKILKSHCLKYI